MAVTFLTNEDKVLTYDEQSLTDEQKAQARANIGVSDSFVSLVREGTTSVNMFNINDSRTKIGVFPSGSYSNPSYNSASGYCATHPILFEQGVTYKWKHEQGAYGNTVRLATINPDTLELINDFSNTTSITQEGDVYYAYFTPDATAYFTIGAVTGARLQSFMVCKADEYPASFVPYGKTLILIDDVRANTAMNSYPLWGKKITLNGDSICANQGGGYGAIIAGRNNMTYQNIAVGGGTITAEQYTNDGTARHWVSRTIANMDATADYAIVEGGVNDASLGVPMGTITSNFSTALDDTTFCGAFESMLKQLIIRFAGKKIGYIAVHKMTTNFRSDNDPTAGTSYYWAAKKCCEKWGVPFLDLNSQVPAFAFFGEASGEELNALRTTYTNNADGWHPSVEGYEKYYCDKIEAWLKSL